MRERIEWQEDSFRVVNTELIFTREEMRRELHTHPDRFSPNVVLRPLYQELILPNLAYVGGGGEIAYWLERKTQFEHFRINFPMLVRRHSVLWVDKSSARKLEKLKLDIRDFLHKDLETIIKDYLNLVCSNNHMVVGNNIPTFTYNEPTTMTKVRFNSYY